MAKEPEVGPSEFVRILNRQPTTERLLAAGAACVGSSAMPLQKFVISWYGPPPLSPAGL